MKTEYRPFDGIPQTDQTALQRDVLITVGRLDDPCAKDVVDAVGAHYPGVYRALNNFADEGLVLKEDSVEDRRENKFSLTDEGAELVAERLRWVSGAVDDE